MLALDALNNDTDTIRSAKAMAELKRDGHVRRSMGTYTADPVFAAYLRDALTSGYRTVAYKATSLSKSTDIAVQIAAREQAQAENIVRQALDRYPQSNSLIHVGFGHVAEAPVTRYGVTAPRMAARLKRLTGIDPLTIDQTTLLQTSSTKPSQPLYPIVVAKAGRKSVVLMKTTRPLVIRRFFEAVDFQVVHPALTLVHGRPNWLMSLHRVATLAPEALRPHRARRSYRRTQSLLPATAFRSIKSFGRQEALGPR